MAEDQAQNFLAEFEDFMSNVAEFKTTLAKLAGKEKDNG